MLPQASKRRLQEAREALSEAVKSISLDSYFGSADEAAKSLFAFSGSGDSNSWTAGDLPPCEAPPDPPSKRRAFQEAIESYFGSADLAAATFGGFLDPQVVSRADVQMCQPPAGPSTEATTSASGTDGFRLLDLPQDALDIILGHCPTASLIALAPTSHAVRCAVDQDDLWQAKIHERFTPVLSALGEAGMAFAASQGPAKRRYFELDRSWMRLASERGQQLVTIGRRCYDVTTFVDEHPGVRPSPARQCSGTGSPAYPTPAYPTPASRPCFPALLPGPAAQPCCPALKIVALTTCGRPPVPVCLPSCLPSWRYRAAD